jgi:hypothetical protein
VGGTCALLSPAIQGGDTVVSHEPFTEMRLFHELVHVVPYEKRGAAGFAAQYVRGFLNGGSYVLPPSQWARFRWRPGFKSG